MLAADPDPEALSRVAAGAGQGPVPILTERLTTQSLLTADPDAVIISSPSGLHFEHGILALSCGFPTFVEKPLACTATEARTLEQAAKRRLFASEQRVYREDLRRVRTIIQSGHIGKILEVRYHDSIVPAPRFADTWRNDPRLAGGGVLLDLGYHTAGAMHWLLDPPSGNFDVTAAYLRCDTLRVENQADISCVAGDVEARLDIRLVDRHPREVLQVRGSLGEVSIVRERKKPSVARISLHRTGREPRTYRVPLDEASDSRSLRDFLHGVSGVGQLRRHIRTLEFLEHAYGRAASERGELRDAAD